MNENYPIKTSNLCLKNKKNNNYVQNIFFSSELNVSK